MTITLLVRVKGGPGSGNYGHAGRPGMVGGSGGRGGGTALGSFRHQGAMEQFRGGIRLVGDVDSKDIPDRLNDKLMSWAGRHDPRVLESMDKLYVAEDMVAWARDHYEAFGPEANPKNTAGWAHGRNIHLRPGGGIQEVFDHEMGHVAWNASGATRAWSQRYYTDDGFDRHTEYSIRGGKSEAFAEAYMSYVKTGGVSKSATYAATYAAVEEVINGIR